MSGVKSNVTLWQPLTLSPVFFICAVLLCSCHTHTSHWVMDVWLELRLAFNASVF